MKLKRFFLCLPSRSGLCNFTIFYVSAMTWKNVLKCVFLEECHTFLRLIKHRNLVYLGKDCGFTAQYLCNSLEKETHYELRFRGRGGGAIYTGKPLPRPVAGKIMTDLNDWISQRFPRHIEKTENCIVSDVHFQSKFHCFAEL